MIKLLYDKEIKTQKEKW